MVKSAGLKFLFLCDSWVRILYCPPFSLKEERRLNNKEIKRIIGAIEELNVEVIDMEIKKHLLFKVKNKDTETIKIVSVSQTPKCKGIYHEIKSSVRKVFRKEGEQV